MDRGRQQRHLHPDDLSVGPRRSHDRLLSGGERPRSLRRISDRGDLPVRLYPDLRRYVDVLERGVDEHHRRLGSGAVPTIRSLDDLRFLRQRDRPVRRGQCERGFSRGHLDLFFHGLDEHHRFGRRSKRLQGRPAGRAGASLRSSDRKLSEWPCDAVRGGGRRRHDLPYHRGQLRVRYLLQPRGFRRRVVVLQGGLGPGGRLGQHHDRTLHPTPTPDTNAYEWRSSGLDPLGDPRREPTVWAGECRARVESSEQPLRAVRRIRPHERALERRLHRGTRLPQRYLPLRRTPRGHVLLAERGRFRRSLRPGLYGVRQRPQLRLFPHLRRRRRGGDGPRGDLAVLRGCARDADRTGRMEHRGHQPRRPGTLHRDRVRGFGKPSDLLLRDAAARQGQHARNELWVPLVHERHHVHSAVQRSDVVHVPSGRLQLQRLSTDRPRLRRERHFRQRHRQLDLRGPAARRR